MLHWYFADDILNRMFLNENFTEICLKCPNDNMSQLVQVMATRRPGDKLLPESMLTQFTDASGALGGDELNISKVYFHQKTQDFQ